MFPYSLGNQLTLNVFNSMIKLQCYKVLLFQTTLISLKKWNSNTIRRGHVKTGSLFCAQGILILLDNVRCWYHFQSRFSFYKHLVECFVSDESARLKRNSFNFRVYSRSFCFVQLNYTSKYYNFLNSLLVVYTACLFE